MEKIDFVITWIDDTDTVWQKSFNSYLPQSRYMDDTRHIRYRNWDNLRYFFRGIEKFAPWVNKVHLITCGHIPDWLDVRATKLHLVRHSDYIPNEYLPVFSSRPIILNLHRITELSEHFVLFDDDMFLIDKVESDRFFRKGLPCDIASFAVISPGGVFTHNIVNNLSLINSAFDKYEILRKHFWKWFSFRAGDRVLRTLVLSLCPNFTGFYDHHFPQIFLKSTFNEVWEKYEDVLLRTTASRFRSVTDVQSWLFRYWQLVKGDFIPLNVRKDSACISISDDSLSKIVSTIENQKKSIVCLNDGDVSSFEDAKRKINSAFQKILPEKSSFEK